MKKDFIPGRNSNLFTFARNYIDRLERYSKDLSLSASEVENARDVISKFMSSFSRMISVKAESKSATEDFYINKKKCVDTLRKISKTGKVFEEVFESDRKKF